jgi:predicted dehydrogenase
MSERTINVGLVGFGYASATFHAPLIRATPGLRLAAVVSSAPDKVREAVPEARVVASPSAMFREADIELVVIATPNQTHFPLAKEALECGRHVVLDKPFVLDTAEARQLLELAEARSRLLSVFHNRRWDGDFITVKQLLADGVLGRITHFESHFDRYRPAVQDRWRESGQAGAGLWYDLGPHLVDQMLALFGSPESVWLDQASQRDGAQADDWFHAVFRYGRMRAVLHASALTARPAPRFTVHGTQGSYVKEGLDRQESVLKTGAALGPGWAADPQDGMLTLDSDAGPVERAHPTCPGAYAEYYGQMRDAILHGAPLPVSPGAATEVVKLMEAGLESMRQRKEVVFSPS